MSLWNKYLSLRQEEANLAEIRQILHPSPSLWKDYFIAIQEASSGTARFRWELGKQPILSPEKDSSQSGRLGRSGNGCEFREHY